MALIEIKNKQEFEEKINNGKYIVDFYAPWCGPCKMLSPVLEEAKEELENRNIDILKINIDEHADLAGDYKILSVPTILYIEEKLVKNSTAGYKTKQQIIELIENC